MDDQALSTGEQQLAELARVQLLTCGQSLSVHCATVLSGPPQHSRNEAGPGAREQDRQQPGDSGRMAVFTRAGPCIS